MIIDEGGWLEGIGRCPSPNCDARPPLVAIDLVVIHCISLPEGHFGGPHVEALFLNQLDCGADPSFAILDGLEVSAHLFIDRAGRSTQFVSLLDRAWHAGVSSFEGRERCNDFSVGIELEGTDLLPFTRRQYLALAGVLEALMRRWPAITEERIVGHSDIAPGRKTDPGMGFDWSEMRQELAIRYPASTSHRPA